MPYATVSDVSTRLGRDLDPTAEVPQVTALIEDVSSLVDAYCRRTFSNSVPGLLRGLVCAEVIRLMNANPGIAAEDVGDVKVEYTAATAGLSRATMNALDEAGLRAKFQSLQMSSNTWEMSTPPGCDRA